MQPSTLGSDGNPSIEQTEARARAAIRFHQVLGGLK